MNDNSSEQDKYNRWVNAVTHCHSKDWRCISGWIFQSPNGQKHDLSAANLNMLDAIESEGHFLVTES